jgi:SWI/SNF-related matrix-associated actin-dependent regulator of chromatin subfamily A-like protein 1
MAKMKQSKLKPIAPDEAQPPAKLEPKLPPKKETKPKLTLKPFQRNAVHALLQKRRMVLGSVMGSGKTAVTIAAALKHRERHPKHGPIFVVLPKSMAGNWKNELSMWLPTLTPEQVLFIDSAKAVKHFTEKTIFVLLTYRMVSSVKAFLELHAKDASCFIADEAHNLKNREALRTIAFFSAAKLAYASILLTATPTPKSAVDAWTLFRFCGGNAFPAFRDYVVRFCKETETPWGRKIYGAKNLAELIELCAPYFHRDGEEVLKEITADEEQIFYLPINATVQHLIDEDMKRRKLEVALKGTQPDSPQHASIMQQLLRCQPLATYQAKLAKEKVADAVDFCSNIIEQDESVVIFGIHLEALYSIHDLLNRSRYKGRVITGDTSAEERTDIVRRFQAGEYNYLVCSIATAGVGITLTHSRTVVFVEKAWNGDENRQAIARVKRLTQERHVRIYSLQYKGSIDESVHNLSEMKSETSDIFVGEKTLTQKKMEALLDED